MAKIIENDQRRIIVQGNYTKRYRLLLIKSEKDTSLLLMDDDIGGLVNFSGTTVLRKLAKAILAEVGE